MASVNQTRSHCVNQMGKTHSKPLAARRGRGTAWARHAMCESPFKSTANWSSCNVRTPTSYRNSCFRILHSGNQISSFSHCNNAFWARPSRHVEIQPNNSSCCCCCNLTRTGRMSMATRAEQREPPVYPTGRDTSRGQVYKIHCLLPQTPQNQAKVQNFVSGWMHWGPIPETWTPVGPAKTSSSRFFLANQQIHYHIRNRRADIRTSVTFLLAASQEWHNSWPRGGDVAEASKDKTLRSHPTHDLNILTATNWTQQ